MALSEWADAQPEPWATVFRFVPIAGAFFLGLALALLWKRKPVPAVKEQSQEPNLQSKSLAEEKLPLVRQELKAALEKNQQQKQRLESGKRTLEAKKEELNELKLLISAGNAVRPSDRDPVTDKVKLPESATKPPKIDPVTDKVKLPESAAKPSKIDPVTDKVKLPESAAKPSKIDPVTDKVKLPESATNPSKIDPVTDKVMLVVDSEPPPGSDSAVDNALSSIKIEQSQTGEGVAVAYEELVQAAPDFCQNSRAEIPIEITHPETPVDWDELLLFRSSDPSIWNQSVNEGENHNAILLNEVPGNIAYLRLRRLDTGEGVVIPIQGRGDLNQDGGDRIAGFNGSNEEFYGACHLGIYSEELPQQVEIRFAYGGWGFGHRPDDEPAQACAWAGQEINEETVMEITVFPSLPSLTDNDQLIDPS